MEGTTNVRPKFLQQLKSYTGRKRDRASQECVPRAILAWRLPLILNKSGDIYSSETRERRHRPLCGLRNKSADNHMLGSTPNAGFPGRIEAMTAKYLPPERAQLMTERS
jgi:hypothetical protein